MTNLKKKATIGKDCVACGRCVKEAICLLKNKGANDYGRKSETDS